MSITYLDPLLPGLLALFVLALVLSWGRMGRVRWILAAGVLGFFLTTWPPFAHLCAYTLESWYPNDTPYPPETDFEAIVVLAADSNSPTLWAPDGLIGGGTYVRCAHAAWLYKNVKAVPVVVSGGPLGGPEPLTHSDLMREALLEKGVPDYHLWIEKESNNTYENTLFSARILREHGVSRVALVTHAFHMPRAAACLRKQGINVVEAPTGFSTPESYAYKDFLPRTQAIMGVDNMIHEWVGLAWYWARGRI